MQQQTANRATHIETRRKATRTVQERILRMLRWGELKYCYFKYERGLEYIAAITGDNTEAAWHMERSDIFWAWWKHAWTMRDEAYLREFTVGVALGRIIIHPACAHASYSVLHDAALLAEESTPPDLVLGKSYTEMMGRLHRCIPTKGHHDE